MNKEMSSIEKLHQQQQSLTDLIQKREDTFDRIGTGTIKVGSSLEATLKVGKAKKAVKKSITRFQEEVHVLQNEIEGYDHAKKHLQDVQTRQNQLKEVEVYVSEGILSQDVLQQHQREYEELTSLPQHNPALQRGLERIQQEDESTQVAQSEVDSQPEENKEIFTLPNNEKLEGDAAKLLHLLQEGSSDQMVTAKQISSRLWPLREGTTDAIKQHAQIFVRQTNALLDGSGLSIKGSRGPKGGYILSRSETEQVQQLSSQERVTPNEEVQPQETVVSEEVVEQGEFGMLTKKEVAILAGAILVNSSFIEPIVNQKGVSLIEEDILEELSDLTDVSVAEKDPRKRAQLLTQQRVQALEKAKNMVESSDFETVWDGINEKNAEVGLLVYHLYEINKAEGRIGNSNEAITGIDFIKALLSNKGMRRVGFVMKSFEGNDVMIYEKTTGGRLPTTEIITETVYPKLIGDQIDEEPWTIPEFTPIPLPKAEQAAEDEHFDEPEAVEPEPQVAETLDEIGVQTQEQAPKVHEQVIFPEQKEEKVSKFHQLEKRDPEIRQRIEQYLDQISERPELGGQSSLQVIRSVFPGIGDNHMINDLIKSRVVSSEHHHRTGSPTFDAAGIATLLYLRSFGSNLPKGMKKNIKNLAADEFAKKQKDK